MPTGVYKRTLKMRKNIAIASSKQMIKRWKNKKFRKMMLLKPSSFKGKHFNSQQKKKISKSLKTYHKNGGTVWNKGLTKKTDDRILKYSINESKVLKKLYKEKKLKSWIKGKTISLKVKRKISKSVSNYLIKQYKNKEFRAKMRNGTLKRAKIRGWLSYNNRACRFFNKLNRKFKLHGRHAKYIGEKSIAGYSLDYYEPKLNLVIEWNEGHHYDEHGRLTQRHKFRQREIKKHLKCKFINIKQKTFNREKIFKKIKAILKVA